jgi:hypothetical protein
MNIQDIFINQDFKTNWKDKTQNVEEMYANIKKVYMKQLTMR